MIMLNLSENEIIELSNKFRYRPSKLSKLMAGNIGLSDAQNREFDKLQAKLKTGKPLTELQTGTYTTLLEKRNNPELPKGAQTLCDEWLIEQIYDRKPSKISNKFLTKGTEQEALAIELLSDFYEEDYIKNEEKFDNKFGKGTPDILRPILINDKEVKIVRDTKCSWDLFSFPVLETKLDIDYYWQIIGYMHLTGAELGFVDYVLVNTPSKLIERELRAAYYAKDEILTEEETELIIRNHRYDDLPLDMKVKTFKVTRPNASVFAEIERRVQLARKYLLQKLTYLSNGESKI